MWMIIVDKGVLITSTIYDENLAKTIYNLYKEKLPDSEVELVSLLTKD